MRRPVQLARLEGLLEEKRGLTDAEVTARRSSYGTNDIIEKPPGGWHELLASTLRDPMIWFLVVTSLLFAAVGNYNEALIMALATIPIVGMDAYLHRRTQASTQGLRSRLAERATVVRDGREMRIPAVDLVPGDLALVTSGEAFPADGLIVAGQGLQVEEAALTGEAFPVRKQVLVDKLRQGDEISIDSLYWGLAGTRLLTGSLKLRVVSTGGDTLYGEIVRSALAGSHARTPLQQAIANLVVVLLAAAGVLCVILAWVRLAQGHGLIDALISAVTLAVAAIPEEFPVVFTFFLGVGVYRLAKRQALVRRAVAVENIGRITCICSDKTGTLTEGRLHIAHALPAAGSSEERLMMLAALSARLETGDPLDLAILETGGVADPGFARLATYPFTEDRRREVAVFRRSPGKLLAAAKGAPETIMAMCNLDEAERAVLAAKVGELAATAHKVIAVASRDLDEAVWAGGEPDRGYILAGLLACEDPLRDGVVAAVRQAQAAGIQVIMVTGDHMATAAAVAREAGIGGKKLEIMEGEEVEVRINQGDMAFLKSVDVIARAVPAQKLSLVRALQSLGEIVAVTGDGVNDVPALQAADIGIAMGERGTRSAREVGAMVLLDDNFRTIVSAIAEGRQLFQNLRLAFAYLLMIHIPLVISAALIPLAGYPLLFLPVHIVWLELIIHPTAMLVFQELPDGHWLGTARRTARLRFFGAWEWLVIALAGGAITLAVVFSYDLNFGPAGDADHARAMAMVALILASATVTAALSRLASRVAWVLVTATIASAVIFVQVPWLAASLHLEPLHLMDWGIAVAGGILPAALSLLIRVNGTGRAVRA